MAERTPSERGMDSMHAIHPSTKEVRCRYCGVVGHFSRDCPDTRDDDLAAGSSKCFNCYEEGHTKAECPNERVFDGTCRFCNKDGHMAKDCPEKGSELCKNCGQEGHKIAECKNARAVDFTGVEEKPAKEAWAAVVAADKERELDEIRDAIKVYIKAVPSVTYQELEHSFRSNVMNTYIIAYEKEVMDTFTLMDMQGNLDRKYTVGFFLHPKPRRSKLSQGWPETPEENVERLGNAGIPVDRKIPKCSNCEKLGHISKSCPEEARERTDRVEIKCMNCDQPGHRVRDCPEPRKDRLACRNCGQPGHKASECVEPRSMDNVECRHCNEKGHFAKDCPSKPAETCRNCGEEGHRAKDCTNEANPALMKCRNCDEMGHKARDCPKPRDWSRVQCRNCGEYGHSVARCKQPIKEEASGEDDGGFGNNGGFDNGGFDNGGFDNGGAGGDHVDSTLAATDGGDW